MWPLSLRLPSRNELTIGAAALLVLLFASWLRRGEKIAVLEAALAAKPRVEFRDRVVEKRVVVRGPIHVVTVQAPDGTKTTTVDKDSETVSTDKARDLVRTETPICPGAYAPRTWGIGGSLNLRRRDRGSVGLSKSFGDITLGLSQAVGAESKLGDLSASASVKVW